MTLPTAPGVYRVRIGHTRTDPVRNVFRYGSYMWMWDLDDPPRLPWVLRPLAGFDRRDHVDVRGVLSSRSIEAARILVLSQARVFGYVFNPLSVYWCYGGDGRLVAQVAEVHNTYGGRHVYVIGGDELCPEGTAEVTKAMYVSPFFPVDGSYRMHLGEPGPTLRVRVDLHRPGSRPFRAWLSGRREKSLVGGLLRNVARYPLGPLGVRVLIQWQGLRLWARGLEVHPR